jgi:hypothetical protein
MCRATRRYATKKIDPLNFEVSSVLQLAPQLNQVKTETAAAVAVVEQLLPVSPAISPDHMVGNEGGQYRHTCEAPSSSTCELVIHSDLEGALHGGRDKKT